MHVLDNWSKQRVQINSRLYYASVTAVNSTQNTNDAAEIQKPAEVLYSASCIETYRVCQGRRLMLTQLLHTCM